MQTTKDRVACLRRLHRLTQQELGEAAGGIGKQAVYQWEKGLTEPDRDAALSLWKTLGVNPRWLAYGEMPMYFTQPTDWGYVGPHLMAALQQIAAGDGVYGQQAGEYKAIARKALEETGQAVTA